MTSDEIDFGYLRGVVMSNSGNLIDASRNYLFESRLQHVLKSKGWQSLDQLISALRSDSGDLQQAVAEAMTINETSFFRDMPTFDLLRQELLPRLISSRCRERKLRFWSAASSSGQEVYSIAIMIREHFPQLEGWKIEILGSDFSAEMVRKAKAGRYQRMEVNRGLPARLLIKYLARVDDEWEIKPEIKSMCQFQQLNLCHATISYRPFDCIFLRNVMFYFPLEQRQEVLLRMHQSLASDGALFLGLSEQPQMDSHWQTVLTSKAVWYRPR
jgi:chemotaxis protein methyltransferase CheR